MIIAKFFMHRWQNIRLMAKRKRKYHRESPNVMHPLVLHAHLAIHNGIVGSITGCVLIGISRNVAADFVYYFTPDGHDSLLRLIQFFLALNGLSLHCAAV